MNNQNPITPLLTAHINRIVQARVDKLLSSPHKEVRQLATRYASAQSIALSGLLYPHSGTLWEVKGTGPEKTYLASRVPPSCPCDYYQGHHRTLLCKHILAIEITEEAKAAVFKEVREKQAEAERVAREQARLMVQIESEL